MKIFWAVVLVLGTLGGMVSALDLTQAVREALVLELGGRLSEALDRYRSALASDPALAQDEGLERPLTVYVVSKTANLSVDLGYGEEATDLAGRLLGSKNSGALEAGTLVMMRLYRLEGKKTQAKDLFTKYRRTGTEPGPALWAEARRAGALVPKTSSLAAWETWEVLPGPSDILGLTVRDSARIQVGAFRDWQNALTLVNMLREKGWSPFIQVKTGGPTGEKLHAVYVISRQPDTDRGRLADQGLQTLP